MFHKARLTVWLQLALFAVPAAGCSCGDDSPAGGGGAGGEVPIETVGGGGAGGVSGQGGGGVGGAGGGGGAPGCTEPMADCDGDPSNGCEVDTSTDPLHCGGCDQPCGVGSCVASTCQTAEVLASGIPTLGDIVSDGSDLYFASAGLGSSYLDGAILRLPNDGGVAPTILVSAVPKAEAIGLDGSNVVFSSDGTDAGMFNDGYLGRVSKTGGAAEVLATVQPFSSQLIVDGGAYFWLCAGSTSVNPAVPSDPLNFHDGAIRAWSNNTLSALVDPEVHPIGLFVDSQFVYWVDKPTDPAGGDGSFHRVPRAGGATELLQANLLDATSITGHAGKIYVATKDAIEVFDSTTPGPLSSFAVTNTVARMVADDTNLYWTEPGGRLLRTKLDGSGSPILLADGLLQPWGLTLEGNYVYFTDRGFGLADGSVLRILK